MHSSAWKSNEFESIQYLNKSKCENLSKQINVEKKMLSHSFINRMKRETYIFGQLRYVT